MNFLSKKNLDLLYKDTIFNLTSELGLYNKLLNVVELLPAIKERPDTKNLSLLFKNALGKDFVSLPSKGTPLLLTVKYDHLNKFKGFDEYVNLSIPNAKKWRAEFLYMLTYVRDKTDRELKQTIFESQITEDLAKAYKQIKQKQEEFNLANIQLENIKDKGPYSSDSVISNVVYL